MTRQALIGRRLRYIGILAGVIFLIAGCPLPFQFTPEDVSGTLAASNDPANPLVTAAPTLRIVENTSGQETTDTTPAADVAIFFDSQTRGASIFYRTDGQAPEPGTAGTTRYSSDVPVSLAGHASAADIRAVAIGPGMYPSLVTEQTVTVTYNQLNAPTFSPAPGIYATGQSVAISAPAGASIYYTIVDGAGPAPDPVPGQAGTQAYAGPISVSGEGTETSIATIAVQDERLDSTVSRGTWGIALAVAPVVITPEGATHSFYAVVSLETATPDATVYYTLDGSDPSSSTNTGRSIYDTPFVIYDSLTVRASAEMAGYNPAPVTSKTYTIAATGLYDDFEDGQVDPNLWTVGTAAGGRVEESDSFERSPNQGSLDGNTTANVYGFLPSGQTGWARLDSVAAGSAWAFTVAEEQMGASAGGVQGWAIGARDPDTGAVVNVIRHANDTNIYQGANAPTNANFVLGGDSVGDYAVRKIGTSLEVYLNGALLRTVDGSAIGPVFQLRVTANNAFGVNVSHAAVAIDNVAVTE